MERDDGRDARVFRAGREARRPPREQGVQGRHQGVDIARHGRFLAPEGLRRSEGRGECLTARGLRTSGGHDRRQPEVGQADQAVAVDQDVRWLDVAVQHAGGVRRREGVGDPDADVANLRRAHRPVPVQGIGQRAGRAQLHHQVGPPVGERARVVDVDDMRVPGEPPRRRHLPDKPPAIPLAEQHAVVHLDGHLAADPQLPAPVDGGEPTRAQHAPDLVPGDVRCGDHGVPA